MKPRTRDLPLQASRPLLVLSIALSLTAIGCVGPASAEMQAGQADTAPTGFAAESSNGAPAEAPKVDETAYIGSWTLDSDLSFELNAEEILSQQNLVGQEREAARAMFRQLFDQMDNRMELLPDGELRAQQTVMDERVTTEGSWTLSGAGIEIVLRQEGLPEDRSEAQLVEGALHVAVEVSLNEQMTLIFSRDS